VLLCVCLNPAVDVTYRLPGPLAPGGSHRIASVREQPGGKAINVARVLRGLGEPARVLAPVTGRNGETVRAGLVAEGFDGADLVDVVDVPEAAGPGGTRRTVTVVAGAGEATVLNEPGPVLGEGGVSAVLERFEALLGGGTITLVVLAGSLPPGVPVEVYATLVRIAHRYGVETFVDAEGPPLRAVLAARPALVKPNLAELEATLGRRLDGPVEIAAAALGLRSEGAGEVVVSCGRDGLVAVTGAGVWRAAGPAVTGNPTGAGDALHAALARGAVRGQDWPDRLRDGVAVSAAAVAAPVAGEVDPELAGRLRGSVRLEPLDLSVPTMEEVTRAAGADR
jgi:tagatose 6-phosphate kinase